MTNDPTLERIWEVRRKIFAQCDNDPSKLVAYHVERQKQNPQLFVQPSGKAEETQEREDISDPTLERIWEVRRKIYAECDNDPRKLVAYYMELQKENPERFVQTGMVKRSSERTASDESINETKQVNH